MLRNRADAGWGYTKGVELLTKGEDKTVATIVIPRAAVAEEEEVAAAAAAPSAAEVPAAKQKEK